MSIAINFRGRTPFVPSKYGVDSVPAILTIDEVSNMFGKSEVLADASGAQRRLFHEDFNTQIETPANESPTQGTPPNVSFGTDGPSSAFNNSTAKGVESTQKRGRGTQDRKRIEHCAGFCNDEAGSNIRDHTTISTGCIHLGDGGNDKINELSFPVVVRTLQLPSWNVNDEMKARLVAEIENAIGSSAESFSRTYSRYQAGFAESRSNSQETSGAFGRLSSTLADPDIATTTTLQLATSGNNSSILHHSQLSESSPLASPPGAKSIVIDPFPHSDGTIFRSMPFLNVSYSSLHQGILIVHPHLPNGNILDRYQHWCRSAAPRPSGVDRELVVRQIIRCALEQLVLIHESGEVHGSVKATNIFSHSDIAETMGLPQSLLKSDVNAETRHSKNRSRRSSSTKAHVNHPLTWASDAVLVDGLYHKFEACVNSVALEHARSNETEAAAFEVSIFDYVLPPECLQKPSASSRGSSFTMSELSPQLKQQRLTAAADLWGLGLTAIHLADGGFPSWLHRQAKPVPSLRQSYWSDKFHAFVQVCVSLNPTQRTTAKALLSDPWFRSIITTPTSGSLTNQNTAILPRNDEEHAQLQQSFLQHLYVGGRDLRREHASCHPSPRTKEGLVGGDTRVRPLKHVFELSSDGQRVFVPQKNYLQSFVDLEFSCLQQVVSTKRQLQEHSCIAGASSCLPLRLGEPHVQLELQQANLVTDSTSSLGRENTLFVAVASQSSDGEAATVQSGRSRSPLENTKSGEVVDDHSFEEIDGSVKVVSVRPTKPPFLASFLSTLESCRRELLNNNGYVVTGAGDEESVVTMQGMQLTPENRRVVSIIDHRFAGLAQAFLDLYDASPICGDHWILSVLLEMRKNEETQYFIDPVIREWSSVDAKKNRQSISPQINSSLPPAAAVGASDEATPTDFNNYLFSKWVTLGSATIRER